LRGIIAATSSSANLAECTGKRCIRSFRRLAEVVDLKTRFRKEWGMAKQRLASLCLLLCFCVASFVACGGGRSTAGGTGSGSNGSNPGGGAPAPTYNSAPGQWTWVSGSNQADATGVYGNQGVPSASNTPGARLYAVQWTDASGNLWLFGGEGAPNDLWEFSPVNGTWTWVSGGNTANTPGNYGTKGIPASTNVPGPRLAAVGWTDSFGNLWLFGGYDPSPGHSTAQALNDLWEFNPSTKLWTWVGGSNTANMAGNYGTLGVPNASNSPGGRYSAVSWTDTSGNLWLFGGVAVDSTTNLGSLLLNDLWKFSPTTNTWTWVSGSSVANAQSYYGTQGVPSTVNMPGAREGSATWTDTNGNLWLFGGLLNPPGPSTSDFLDDLWVFNPSNKTWTWVSGSKSPGANGTYTGLGIPSVANTPGARFRPVSWTDRSGNLWLFGGEGEQITWSGTTGTVNSYLLNDLWMFNPSNKTWTWVSGSNTANAFGNYGTLGTPSASNVPGARDASSSWIDRNGDLWLFGGTGYALGAPLGTLNDLWLYHP
jgi:hypothetical protein